MHKKCKKHTQECAIQGDISYISEGFRGKKVQKLKTKPEERACTWEKTPTCIVGVLHYLILCRKQASYYWEKASFPCRAAISGSQVPKETLDQEAPEQSLPPFFPPKLRERHLNLNTRMVSSDVDSQTKQPRPKSQPTHLQPVQLQGQTQVFLQVPSMHCLSSW